MESNSMKPANKYEKEVRVIMRSDIHFADYNPRIIDSIAKKRLSQNIEKVGLLGGIVWNERTGRLVAGHQRIADLDKKYKGKDYQVTVVVVNLDEKQEKEQNIFMNNPNAQGTFEFSMLGDVLKSGIDAIAAGFDPAEIHKLYGNSIEENTIEEIKEMADNIRKIEETMTKVKDDCFEKNNNNFYLVVVFRSYEDRKKFTDEYNLEDNMYVSSDTIENIINKNNLEEET